MTKIKFHERGENIIIYAMEPLFDQIIDQSDPNEVYIGWAEVGTKTNEPKWRIKRIKTINGISYIGWADGDLLFDNVWDERRSLNYSQGEEL